MNIELNKYNIKINENRDFERKTKTYSKVNKLRGAYELQSNNKAIKFLLL